MRTGRCMAAIALVLTVAFGAMAAQQPPHAAQRPRDPWVFRCVLDQRPRVVVIALKDDIWAAYDSTTCSLYKVWRGDVKFDGAVYTTVHGPQPTSEGQDVILAPADPPWTLMQPGKGKSNPAPRWLGYRFLGGQVHMRYRVEIDGMAVVIVETPEIVMHGEEPTFVRTIRVEGLPETTRLGMMIPKVDSAGRELRMFVNGRPMILKPGDTSKAVDLPVSSMAMIEVMTFLPAGRAGGGDAPIQSTEKH